MLSLVYSLVLMVGGMMSILSGLWGRKTGGERAVLLLIGSVCFFTAGIFLYSLRHLIVSYIVEWLAEGAPRPV